MKTKGKWVMICLVTLTISTTGCDDKNENYPPEHNAKTGSLTFKLKTSELNTKALYATASDEEKAVHTIHAFVYRNDGTLEKTVTFPVEDFTSTGNIYELNANIAIKELSEGNKTVYVGVNMPATLTTAIVANGAAGLSSQYVEALTNMTSSSSGYTMFAEAGRSTTVVKGVTTSIDDVFIVTRIMAKASVKTKTGFTLPHPVAGGTVTSMMYTIQNHNTKFYLSPAVSNPLTTLENSPPGSFQEITELPAGEEWDATHSYMLENYQDPDKTGIPSYPTYIRVRCSFKPDLFITGTAGSWITSDTNTNPDGTFWIIPMANGKTSYFDMEETAINFLDDITTEPKATGATIKAYPNGHMDYGIFLHSSPNKFDVRRNHYYTITITTVNGLGHPETHPQILPTEKGHIDFTLEVNDWIPMPSDDEQLS